jgi:hypothetical protein
VGAWGEQPWENDSAADWFGDLWDGTPIVERVHAGLRSEDSFEAVAALWTCSHLCRVYVWPVATIDDTLELGISAADRILSGDDDEGFLSLWDDRPDIRQQIEDLRTQLVERRR